MASAARAGSSGGGKAAPQKWDNSRSAAGPYNPWLIVAMISLPTFMEVLDTSIANVSLDHIAGGLSISTDQATWVLTSYLIANAVVIPISGWLSDAIGRKRYFLISIALFTASSLACGLAPNIGTLIIARVMQGVGGGGLAPVEQAMLVDTFPPEKRGLAIAAFAIVVVVGPVLGPTLGGYITEIASWHWVFLINVPFGIIAFFLANLFVDEPDQVKKDRAEKLKGGLRIDIVGVVLVVLGLGGLELTLDRGEREGWLDSGFIIATIAVAVVSLVALAIWEWRQKNPVVDVKLLKNRNFSATLIIMGVTGLILYGTTQLIPQMLQQVLGYSSFQSGLALTLGGIATVLMVPFAGIMAGKVDVRILLGVALLIQAAALWHMTHLSADITFLDAAMARTYQAIGLPFLFVPINAAAYNGLPRESTAQASSMLNVARNVGGSIGISMSQSWLVNSVQTRQSQLVEGLNPLNPNYTDWMARAGGALGGSGGDQSMIPTAALYQQVLRQAAMMGFLDVFGALMILVLVLTPTVFLLRGGGGSSEGMGH